MNIYVYVTKHSPFSSHLRVIELGGKTPFGKQQSAYRPMTH